VLSRCTTDDCSEPALTAEDVKKIIRAELNKREVEAAALHVPRGSSSSACAGSSPSVGVVLVARTITVSVLSPCRLPPPRTDDDVNCAVLHVRAAVQG
jgi:hypothetical protein